MSTTEEEMEAEKIADIVCSEVETQLERNGHNVKAIQDTMKVNDWKYYNLILETIEDVEEREM